MSDNITRDNQLRVGADLGTGYSAFSVQHIKGPFHVTNNNPPLWDVALKRNQPVRIKQIAILLANGEVICGAEDVENAVVSNPEAQYRPMELFKLCLHPEFKDLPEVRNVLDILHASKDDGAVLDFFIDYLCCIFKDIRRFAREDFPQDRDLPADYWDTVKLIATFSVPSMWDDRARGLLRRAALAAGAAHVDFRDEALCNAASYMEKLIKQDAIRPGDRLLTVDCGKGTLDASRSLLLQSDPMRIERIGLTDVNGAGAHTLNVLACDWVTGCEEVVRRLGFDRCCSDMGIEQSEFFRQFSNWIDHIKEGRVPGPEPYHIPINGDPKALHQHLTISVPRELVDHWLNVWVTTAVNFVHKFARTMTPEYAVLTGGGADSRLFRERMTSMLQELGIVVLPGTIKVEHACTRGALTQNAFPPDMPPKQVSFYLARGEPYQPRFHRHVMRRGIIDRDYDEVPNRLVKLMEYTAPPNPDLGPIQPLGAGFHNARTIPIWFQAFDGKLARFEINLLHSETNRPDHRAMYDRNGKLLSE